MRPIDVAFFDAVLTHYEINPVRDMFEMIGGCRLEVEGVQSVIPIELFYHLPNVLRCRILKHIFKTAETAYAWSLYINHSCDYFPHHYRPAFDKTKDVVIQAILKEIDEGTPSRIPIATKRLVWHTCIGESIGKANCLCSSEMTQLSFQCGYIVPELHSGPSKISNLRPICSMCKIRMGTKTMEEWMSLWLRKKSDT